MSGPVNSITVFMYAGRSSFRSLSFKVSSVMVATMSRPCSKIYLLIDALDECPELNQARQTVLERIERLTRDAPNLRVFATSRELDRIRMSMEALPAEPLRVMTRAVDADIQIYVAKEVSRDRRLYY